MDAYELAIGPRAESMNSRHRQSHDTGDHLAGPIVRPGTNLALIALISEHINMRATRVDAASTEQHMRWLLSLALLVVAPTTTWAQEPDRSEGTSVEASVTAEPSHTKVADKKFWLLGAALNTSMLLDTKSTVDVTRRCIRCVDTNPYPAPFVNRGPAVAFTAGEAFDLA